MEIRHLVTHQDFQACIDLQEETWGAGFSERVPSAILHIARRLGGVVAGAFDRGGSLCGFVFGLTGVEGVVPVHWSDMLAVTPSQRGRGLGVRLKSFQREDLLARGIRRMYWTFDPLEAGNAYLNLCKLGVVSSEYVVDMYGGNTGSPLHAGIGTDRLVVLWQMDDRRVTSRLERALAGEECECWPMTAISQTPAALDVDVARDLPRPTPPVLSLEAPVVRVAVPADVQSIKAQDPQLATAWRQAIREVLRDLIKRGYEVRDFARGSKVSWYGVGKKDGDES